MADVAFQCTRWWRDHHRLKGYVNVVVAGETEFGDAIKLDPRDLNLRREQENILVLAGRHQDVLNMTEAMARDGRAPYWVFMNRGRARHGLKDDAAATNEFNAGLTAAVGAECAASACFSPRRSSRSSRWCWRRSRRSC